MAEHRPVLLSEAVAALAVRADGTYLDATFGRGGHSRAILAALGPQGRLVALDRDPQAVAAGLEIRDPRFSITHAHFSQLGEVLDAAGIARIDGALFDLGVSSPQIDEAQRGFSFRMDGPLDMRMDPTRGESAAQWLARADESDIREVIKDYGEERFAKQIAAAIVAARATEPVGRTRQLAKLVGEAVRTREAGQDPATRTFQALRIFINRELEEVSLSLPQAASRLAPGGRLAVISFHSLEDRIVKRFIRACGVPELPRDLPLRASELPPALLEPVGRAVKASAAEVRANPRSRSATLRIAERTGAPWRN
ncbi:MAG: 16S rRNA (cytosine(1402)-N(4))-methyltransferase RsmH [Proteobacteria bacterium]|nr:16S rRNA (cytosine(1402)-N(4))-methyltransferase RsmH [Pseudomonadota bacterium]